MRFGIILLVLLFAGAGALFGAMNSERIVFDFYFTDVSLPKGAALLAALMAGWLVGGVIVYLGVVLSLRRRVRTLAHELKRRPQAADAGSDSDRAA